MTQEEAGREQDQGRAHRRRRIPADRDASLLAEWQDVLRAELRAVIDELGPGVSPGVGLDGQPLPAKRPALAQRRELVALGVTVARELGTAVDPAAPVGGPAPAPPPRRRAKVDYG